MHCTVIAKNLPCLMAAKLQQFLQHWRRLSSYRWHDTEFNRSVALKIKLMKKYSVKSVIFTIALSENINHELELDTNKWLAKPRGSKQTYTMCTYTNSSELLNIHPSVCSRNVFTARESQCKARSYWLIGACNAIWLADQVRDIYTVRASCNFVSPS